MNWETMGAIAEAVGQSGLSPHRPAWPRRFDSGASPNADEFVAYLKKALENSPDETWSYTPLAEL